MGFITWNKWLHMLEIKCFVLRFWMIEELVCLFFRAQYIFHKIRCTPDMRALSPDFSWQSAELAVWQSYPDGRRKRPPFPLLWRSCVSDHVEGRRKMQLFCQFMNRIGVRRALRQVFIVHSWGRWLPLSQCLLRALHSVLSVVQGWVHFTLKALRLVSGISDYICNSS